MFPIYYRTQTDAERSGNVFLQLTTIKPTSLDVVTNRNKFSRIPRNLGDTSSQLDMAKGGRNHASAGIWGTIGITANARHR